MSQRRLLRPPVSASVPGRGDDPPSVAVELARLAAIVESSNDAILAADRAGTITAWNPAAERIYGYSAAEAIGRHVSMLVPPERAGEDRRILDLVLAGERVDHLETTRLRRDGRRVGMSLVALPVRDRTGAIVAASVVARETGERPGRGRFDELTGLPNRTVFAEAVTAALDPAPGPPAAVAVAHVDVDRFHELNEAVGRDGGDAILRGLVATLSSRLPADAMLARLGGDQFGILLRAAAAARLDEQLAALVHDALPAVATVGEISIHVDASAGVATAPAGSGTAEELLRAAERALRAAKLSRSGVERYDASRHGSQTTCVTVAGEVREALARGQLVLHFQPQVDVATGALVGAEGLIRWEHPERGLLGPGAFLPSVERSSLMRALTVEALGQALAQVRRWHDEGLELGVSVNLSALNLLDLGIAHDVAELLVRHRVPASALCLEITEDALMVDPDRAAGVLAGLQAMGVDMAVDDFGTGYSSLAYLQRLPIRELKIDRCFVRDMATRPADAAIVRSTIDMAHNLGLRVVAEGIEDAAALALLGELGCDRAQGFHLGRPMPADELTALARATRVRAAAD